jgi:hypothetical protein
MEVNNNIDALTIINTPPIQEDGRGEEVSGKVNISQDLQAQGAFESGKMSGNPKSLSNWLDKIHNEIIFQIEGLNVKQSGEINELKIAVTGLKEHNETVERRIIHINDDIIVQKKEKINSIEREKETELKHKNNFINELKVEVERIRGGDLSLIGAEVKAGDKAGFIIGISILICLTGYLFLFYTSVIYNAFLFDPAVLNDNPDDFLKNISSAIVNLNAIPNTWSTNGVIGAFFLCFAPAMFLALGYLIYKFNQEKAHLKTFVLYATTLLFDALLAYEIVRKMHEIKLSSGMVEEPWEVAMVLPEISFYIIICAGFLVYILWGIILSYSLEEADKLQPAKMAINVRKEKIRQKKEAIEQDEIKYKNFIGSVRKEIEEFQDEITNQKNKINNNITAIETKNKKIETINNTIEVPHSEIIKKVKTFTVGWTNYINSAFVGEDKTKLINQSQEVIDSFIQKIKFKPSNQEIL